MEDAGQDAAVAVIWIDMLPSDSEAAARRAGVLVDDSRVTQFHDPHHLAGKAWGATLGIQGVAWDTYFVFDRGAAWEPPAPRPHDWFHQLGGDRADPARWRSEGALARALYDAGRQVGWPVAPQPPGDDPWSQARDKALSQISDNDPNSGQRCARCRAAARVTACSMAGWRRVLLRWDSGGRFMASPTEPAGDAAGRRRAVLAVSPMECPECMLRAGAAALAVPGVREVEVRLNDGKLRALIEDDAATDPEEIVTAVREERFEVQVISAPDGARHGDGL